MSFREAFVETEKEEAQMSEDRENLEGEDVEAHVKHGGGHGMSPDAEGDEVEAHVKHGGGHGATQGADEDDDAVEAHRKF